MNYQDYTKQLSHKFIRNDQESERILKFLFERISQDLAKGKWVRFRGFGSFRKVIRPPRKYRNIATGKVETRPPKKDVQFNPSKKLLKRISKNRS